MRSITLLVLLCSGAAVLPAQNLKDKLAAHFSFASCKGTDDSGNGSSGALIGTPSCGCGVRDSSLRLDDPNDAVVFVGPLSEVFTTGDFSVSFYFRPIPPAQGQGATQVIMAKQARCDRNRTFAIRYQPSTNTIASTISQNDSLFASVAARLDRNVCWHHIVLVRANSRYSLYINGTLRDSRTSASRLDITTNAPLKIGETVCPLERAYSGDLDEFRLYNRPLRQEDIDALYLRPDRILTNDTLIYLGNSFRVNTAPSCQGGRIDWTPSAGVARQGDANPVITPSGPTVFYVQFRYAECLAQDSIVVSVIDPDTLDCTKIFIPNAFTPGASEGRNDQFGVSNPFAVDEFISFEIFDRWGGKVFEAENKFSTWDGLVRGRPANPGVFLYRLRYKCDGTEQSKTGSLSIIR